MIVRYICLVLLWMFSSVTFGQDCDTVRSNIYDGEYLRYKLHFNWGFVWIPAGEAVFRVKESEDDYHVTVVGETYKSYDRLFHVKNVYKSTFDKRTFRPSEFLREVEENDYRRFDSLRFDRANGTVHRLQGRTKEEAKWSEVEVDKCALDLVSIMYYFRTLETDDLKKGDKVSMEMYFDDRNYPISLRMGKRKRRKIKPLGKFDALMVEPSLITGSVFKEDANMKIWVSDDERKIPLQISSPLLVGSIKATLVEYNAPPE